MAADGGGGEPPLAWVRVVLCVCVWSRPCWAGPSPASPRVRAAPAPLPGLASSPELAGASRCPWRPPALGCFGSPRSTAGSDGRPGRVPLGSAAARQRRPCAASRRSALLVPAPMVSAMLLPDPELEGSIWAGLGRADPNSQILGWICRATSLGLSPQRSVAVGALAGGARVAAGS